MKLPFTWAELSPEDKAWLGEVPAPLIWNFIDTLPKLERLPFDDPYHAPNGAEFMRKYGTRLRAYVSEHENDPLEIDPELDAALNAIDPELIKEGRRGMEELESKLHAGEIGFDKYEAELGKIREKWAAHPSTAKIQAFHQKGIDEVDAYYNHFAPNGRIDNAEDLLAAQYRATIAQLLEAAQNFRKHQQADQKKITELSAEIAKLKAERDAALKARDEILKLYADQHGG